MLATLSTTLTLLALAAASPLRRAAPQLSRAKAYQLQAVLYSPSLPDLDPPIAGQYLSGVHTGAGQNIAVVGPHSDPSYSYPPYYTNGTAADGYTDVLNDLGTSYPWGVQVADAASTDATYAGEHDVALNAGGGTDGVGIAAWGDERFLGGTAPGIYAVCERFLYTHDNLTVVRFVYDGEVLPQGCVGIHFVPICAELPALPAGSEWNHDFVQEVDCVPASS
ncbi:hypothetical protein F4819DRAFT_322698 [Hypoxylon fuscum]|nr:hypothetical protein F4819DRAFT_322698 [Hypoxylon fuscum]